MEPYSLYIDDIRSPKLAAPVGEWVICRNIAEVKDALSFYGSPAYVSFDHDLGEDEFNGYCISKYLCRWFQDNGLPENFSFNVHSANPVGAENIRCYMTNCMKYLKTT